MKIFSEIVNKSIIYNLAHLIWILSPLHMTNNLRRHRQGIIEIYFIWEAEFLYYLRLLVNSFYINLS